MIDDSRSTFEAHSRNSIALARDNLAEVTLYRLRTRYHEADTENMWHLMGNLVIASSASAGRGGTVADGVADALERVGADPERARPGVRELLTGDSLRMIFALQHIPSSAPEVIETQRSRMLHVSKFIQQAHMLNPSSQEPTQYVGNGNGLFLGWYHRTLS